MGFRVLTYIVLVVAAVVSRPGIAMSQSSLRGYDFRRIGIESGLSHNQINGIYEDRRGFVWACTGNGLNCLDGHRTLPMMHDPYDKNSLPVNFTSEALDICPDTMLIRSQDRYFLMDKAHQRFSQAGDFFSGLGIEGAVSKVVCDENWNLWIVSGSTCYVRCPGAASLLSLSLPMGGGMVSAITPMPGGVAMSLSNGRILICTSPTDGELRAPIVMSAPFDGGASTLFADRHGDLWAITQGRTCLWHCSQSGQHVLVIGGDTQNVNAIGGYILTDVAEDPRGDIWVTSNHGGIFVVSRSTGGIRQLRHVTSDSRSLSSDACTCVKASSDGTMWVGTSNAGISLYNQAMYKFDVQNFNLEEGGSLGEIEINTMADDRHGNIWYGSNGMGLLVTDANTSKTKLFRHDPQDPGSLPSDVVVDICEASDGSIWVGTYMGGLARYKGGGKFERFLDRHDVAAPMASSYIWAVTEDKENQLWIGSLDKGLACMNSKTGETKVFNVENGRLQSNEIINVEPLHNGMVIVATTQGAELLDGKSGEHIMIEELKGNPLWTEHINDLYNDSRHMLWIGTNHGLIALDCVRWMAYYPETTEGLPTDVISSIAESVDHSIWVSTMSGCYSISLEKTSDGGYSFKKKAYTSHDGLLPGPFNQRSYLSRANGDIFFGGLHGVNRISTTDIAVDSRVPKVVFCGLRVMGRDAMMTDNAYEKAGIKLDVSLVNEPKITLRYGHEMFSVLFSSLSFLLPEKVVYTYQLDDFGADKIETSDPYVSFSNLSVGHHKLKVWVTNSDGLTSAEPSILEMDVLAPWWMSSVAMVVYALLLCGLVFFFYYTIRYNWTERRKLMAERGDVIRQREQNEMNARFLNNICIELQTPLSHVLDDLDKMGTEGIEGMRMRVGDAKEQASRMKSAIEQVRQLGESTLEELKLEPSTNDIVALARTVCDRIDKEENGRMNLSLSSSDERIIAEFDKEKIGVALSCLLHNAYRNLPDFSNIDVWVGKSFAESGRIEIRITDNGVELPRDYEQTQQSKDEAELFARHNMMADSVGLHVVNEYIALHGGTVEVFPPKSGGTLFLVVF